jgi:hypothetical protein
MVTNYDRISQSQPQLGTGRFQLHETDGNVITVNNFRTGYDESDYSVHLDQRPSMLKDQRRLRGVPFQPEMAAASRPIDFHHVHGRLRDFIYGVPRLRFRAIGGVAARGARDSPSEEGPGNTAWRIDSEASRISCNESPD